MPNGFTNDPHYAEIIAGYEAFFSPLVDVVIAFAHRHNLKVVKYYHGGPCWSLGFSHPVAGSAKIELCRRDDTTLSIGGIWWVDDYDTATRTIRTIESIRLAPLTVQLDDLLTAAFKAVLQLTSEDPAQVFSFADTWHRTWTKEQFGKQERETRYPVPIY